MKSTQSILKISDIQKPEQFLELIGNPHVRDFVALVCMSRGVFASDGRPDWVIRAAGEFWRSCFDFSKTERSRSEAYELGIIWGFVRQLGPQLQETQLGLGEQRLMAMLTSGELGQLMHSVMESAPILEAADFYGGLSEGLKRPIVISPSSPFLVYLLLAMMWREVSELKNTTQIHAWLEAILGANLTGSRDRIAKLLQKVRFPLTDKGGRPKGKPRKRLPS